MMTIKVGTIGCGGIVDDKRIPSLQKVENAEMVAFCDVDISRAACAAETYDTDNVKVYDDYKTLLKDDTIDVIHVCIPNDSHYEATIAGLHTGEHVMCERPIAKTTAEVQKMADTAKSAGKKSTIGYQNRLRPDSQFSYKSAQRGDLGDICFGKTHAIRHRTVPIWDVFLDGEAQGGRPLTDISTHALDLTLWMMDNYKLGSMVGSTSRRLGKRHDVVNAWGSWSPGEFIVEDLASGFIKMKNGAMIILESAWTINSSEMDGAKCSLSGTEAGIDMKGGLRIHGEDVDTLYIKHIELENKGVDFCEGNEVDEAEEEAKVWIGAVVSDTEPIVKPERAMVIIETLKATYQSAKPGKAIYSE